MWALVLSALLVAAPSVAQTDGKDPDRLYADREQLASARQAADIWEARLTANARDFESAWKLARACYWLGGHVPADEQRQQYERGIKAATRAVELEPERPEGHFWMAADMGAMAESFGVRAGHPLPRSDQDGARDRAPASIPPSSRDPPIARSDAGTSECLACSAAARTKPSNT